MPEKFLKASCNTEDYKSVILTENPDSVVLFFFFPLRLLPLHFWVEKTKILNVT